MNAPAKWQTAWACVGFVLTLGGCSKPAPPPPVQANSYMGSASCENCHKSEYDRWKVTLMANVVQDPKQRPQVILGDFSKPNPLVTFRPEDVAFVYGTKWKQRYWKKQGDD